MLKKPEQIYDNNWIYWIVYGDYEQRISPLQYPKWSANIKFGNTDTSDLDNLTKLMAAEIEFNETNHMPPDEEVNWRDGDFFIYYLEFPEENWDNQVNELDALLCGPENICSYTYDGIIKILPLFKEMNLGKFKPHTDEE